MSSTKSSTADNLPPQFKVSYTIPNVSRPNWKRPMEMARWNHKGYRFPVATDVMTGKAVTCAPVMASQWCERVKPQREIYIQPLNFHFILRIEADKNYKGNSLDLCFNGLKNSLPLIEGPDGKFFDFKGYGLPVIAMSNTQLSVYPMPNTELNSIRITTLCVDESLKNVVCHGCICEIGVVTLHVDHGSICTRYCGDGKNRPVMSNYDINNKNKYHGFLDSLIAALHDLEIDYVCSPWWVLSEQIDLEVNLADISNFHEQIKHRLQTKTQ